jgi:type II secretory pathway pseudopilin PulG
MHYMRDNKGIFGFTFVEIIIVMILVSIISLGIFATLNNGLKIWQKASQRLLTEDLNIFFDKFRSDVKNCFKFTGINFLGSEESLELTAIVNSPNLSVSTVGKIIYLYDNADKLLQREVKDFSQIYNGQDGIVTLRLNNIKSLKFEYYYYDKKRNEYLWEKEWTGKSDLPLAIRLTLQLNTSDQDNKFIKTVSIPAGGHSN